MPKITITIESEQYEAELDEELAPATIEQITAALPIEATANTWGEEIYFTIPVDAAPENPVETVRVGDLAYWPEGSAFCIFFGKTPMSASEEQIVPASAVNPIGRIDECEGLKKYSGGETVRIERA